VGIQIIESNRGGEGMRLEVEEFANGCRVTEFCDMGRSIDQRICETGASLSKYVLDWGILREVERIQKEEADK